MSLLTQLARLIPPTFRPNYCPPNLQAFANDLIGGTQVTFLIQSGTLNQFYNFGSTTPTPENRLWPWLYTPTGQWFTFQYGLWVSPMDPTERELSFRRIWKPDNGTTENALWSLDGGDGADPTIVPPTPISGAAWKVDHDFDGKIPCGVGNVATDPITSVSLDTTATFGEANQKVTLTSDSLPRHNHAVGISPDSASWVDQKPTEFNFGVSDGHNFKGFTGDSGKVGYTEREGAATVTPININKLQPVRGVYFIQPTIKRYYTLPA